MRVKVPSVKRETLSKELWKERESARSTTILTASYFDTLLERALRAVLVNSPSIESLFEGQGALATSSSKIRLAFALGLISDQMRADLDAIRKLRNHFAHEIVGGSFEEEPAKSHLARLSGYPFAAAICSSSEKRVSSVRLFGMITTAMDGMLEAELRATRRRRPVPPPGVVLPVPTSEELAATRARMKARKAKR